MKRVDSESVAFEVTADFEKIQKTCNVYQREEAAPHQFHVPLSHEECAFNRNVSLDLIKHCKEAVLLAVY